MRANYLYFAESTVSTNGAVRMCDPTGALIPARNYMGVDPSGENNLIVKFKSPSGTAEMILVDLTIVSNTHKLVIKTITDLMNSDNSTGFIVVADNETIGTVKIPEFHNDFNGNVTACAIAYTLACS